MTRIRFAKRLSGAALAAVVAMACASFFAAPATADSLPAAGCVTACTATFNTAGATDEFGIPAGVTSLTSTISGAAGDAPPAGITDILPGTGGNGGVTTVNLGAAYAGQTIILGVGDTGEGSYIQTTTTLLAVAGGGGGAGYAGDLIDPTQVFATYPGGDGGSPSASGVTPGASGTAFGSSTANGGGGTTLAGVAGIGTAANGTAGGATTTVTGSGSTLASGGAAGSEAIGAITYAAGAGGSGYTGGGGGAATSIDNGDGNFIDLLAPGGGGAGYLDASLTATAGTPNPGGGSVTFTWSYSPTISTTTTTAHRGDTVPVTITGLPPTSAFTVVFDGTTVITGTSDASGDATESFTVGSGQVAGSFTLDLVAGGGTVAISDPITVIVVLAATGSTSPMLPGALAALLVLVGAGAIMFVRRGRKTPVRA